MILLTENYDHEVTVRQHGALVFLRFDFNREMIDAVKRFDRARWMPNTREWAIPASRRNLWQLRAMAEGGPMDRYLEKSKVWTPPAPRFSNQLGKALPHRVKQCEMVAHALKDRQCIIGAEMRTGKSLAYIEIAEDVLRRHPGALIWYVAPSKALVSFELERDNWGCTAPMEMMTYEGFRSRVKALDEETRDKSNIPLLIIYDEGSKLKGHSQRTKAAIQMADWQDDVWGEDVCYRILGTGTPQPKNLLDWFFQVESVRPGFLPWGNIHKLTEYLQVREKTTGMYGNDFWQFVQWKDGSECVGCAGKGVRFRKTCDLCNGAKVQPDHCSEFKKLLANIALVVRKKDVLELPEKEIVVLSLKPPASMLNVAKVIAEQGGSAVQILERHKQLTDGFQYVHKTNASGKQVKDTSKTMRGATPKDAATLQLLAKHEECGRFVIYSAYSESTSKLCDMAAKEGWKVIRCDGEVGWKTWDGRPEKQALIEFMSGERSAENKICFIGHPKSAGYALDLAASPGFLLYSMDFDGETFLQAIERGHSSGMNFELGCTLYFFEVLPTCRLVRENLMGKKESQETTKDDILAVMRGEEIRRAA